MIGPAHRADSASLYRSFVRSRIGRLSTMALGREHGSTGTGARPISSRSRSGVSAALESTDRVRGYRKAMGKLRERRDEARDVRADDRAGSLPVRRVRIDSKAIPIRSWVPIL